MKNEFKVCVFGLGYVGLPLAVAIAKKYNVIGYDINETRITELSNAADRTNEVPGDVLRNSTTLAFTNLTTRIQNCNVYILCVPTPIDADRRPDLKYVIDATRTIGKVLRKDDIFILESTVYPGVTEEVCVPILEEESGLKLNETFSVAYSPERINPGDKVNTVDRIRKVVSASNSIALDKVDALYSNVISAGTHRAKTIKIAEAAKVIENAQRDINIAFVNELALIFDRLGIDTHSVLDAAATKWNFNKYLPGLVGGHCIGVDPYYLTYKAEQTGFFPKLILAGRETNEQMSEHCAQKCVQLLLNRKINPLEAKVLIAGATFKENCPDIRNTKILDLINNIKQFHINIDLFDPTVTENKLGDEIIVKDINHLEDDFYDVIILAVPHDVIIKNWNNILSKMKSDKIFIDLKGYFDVSSSDYRL